MLYLTEGDYINAGLSALSIIPGADAFTKTGKASKVLGNGIVESGLKHLDNVADGIKKLVKKADDAIDLEKHLPKKLLTEEAEAFAKKADKVADDVVEDAAKAIKSGKYSGTGEYGDVGGHHVHAKAGFKGDINYDPKKGFSISQDFMKENGLDHNIMTSKQRELFKELYESGRPNTLEEHTRIAREALKAGGASDSMIDDLINASLKNLLLEHRNVLY